MPRSSASPASAPDPAAPSAASGIRHLRSGSRHPGSTPVPVGPDPAARSRPRIVWWGRLTSRGQAGAIPSVMAVGATNPPVAPEAGNLVPWQLLDGVVHGLMTGSMDARPDGPSRTAAVTASVLLRLRAKGPELSLGPGSRAPRMVGRIADVRCVRARWLPGGGRHPPTGRVSHVGTSRRTAPEPCRHDRADARVRAPD